MVAGAQNGVGLAPELTCKHYFVTVWRGPGLAGSIIGRHFATRNHVDTKSIPDKIDTLLMVAGAQNGVGPPN